MLEDISTLLNTSKGYVIFGEFNLEDGVHFVGASGGWLSVEMLALLLAKSIAHSKKLAEKLSAVDCNCTECQAKRENIH